MTISNVVYRMTRIQWKSRRTAVCILLLVTSFFLLRIKNYNYQQKATLRHVKPVVAWEFVADFSNMKLLNPTIVDFAVITESGHYDNWKYTVEYSEFLSHWPYLKNKAVAIFDVKILDKNAYVIISEHKTCFLLGTVCLRSLSEFKFVTDGPSSTIAEEMILYQCPALFYWFCNREVEYQRNEIFSNLKKRFDT